eukprot:1697535-Alexandrium_andersonii.AAC.1
MATAPARLDAEEQGPARHQPRPRPVSTWTTGLPRTEVPSIRISESTGKVTQEDRELQNILAK